MKSYFTGTIRCSYGGSFGQSSPRPREDLSGAEGDRTPDLLNAIQALSHLSYGPAVLQRPRGESNPYRQLERLVS